MMPKRVGRPMVDRAPNERVPLATRVRGSIYNKLIEAALANDRPLGNEVEMRLEASFAPPHPLVPNEDLAQALMMLARYKSGGEIAVITGFFYDAGTDQKKFTLLEAMKSALWTVEHENKAMLDEIESKLPSIEDLQR